MTVGGESTGICTPPMAATSNGAFQDSNPLDYSLPLLIVQIVLVVVLTRTLAFILRPLRQPRVIAEIIGGILLGPSAFGRNEAYLEAIFPKKSLTVLDTIANIGLLFFLFLVGLELDMKTIRRTGKKALGVALAGITLPFVLGIGTSIVLRKTIANNAIDKGAPFLVFMGVSLSITAFPVLARILSELKLLTTDVGRMAMSAAAVNDVAAWILLALAIALSSTGKSPLISLYVLLCGIAFVAFAIIALHPVLSWMAHQSPNRGEPVKEIYVCATLTLVLAAGFLTDTIGIHALFGAFIVGLVMPKEGAFSGAMVEKIEDLVSGLFLPLYFVSSGLKTNVASIQGAQSWGLLVLVIFNACFGKIVGTITVSLLCKIPLRESIALGFLMNTKGLVELIVLNIGRDRKVLNDQTFAIMVLMALFTTFMTTPLVTTIYKPARKASQYKHRSIQRKGDSQLRMLVCIHSMRQVPALINLIEASRGTNKRPVSVYAMHLMELSERPSAILMVHKARNDGRPFWDKSARPSDGADQIIVAFEAYHQLCSVSVKPMTAISDLKDMHEDICGSAEDKRAAIIILPFHKQQRLDGNMEGTSVGGFRSVNMKVLKHAPCSVGILVDRGLGGATHLASHEVSYSIAALFFGGCDDREALAYGCRMAEHPGISLIVVRFVTPGIPNIDGNNDSDAVTISVEGDDQAADEEFLEQCKGNIPASGSIEFVDKTVSGRAETVAVIKEFSKSNLILVGRTARTGPLVEVTELPELGPVGCLLVSPQFKNTSSILVMQQYRQSGVTSVVSQPAADSVLSPDNEDNVTNYESD